MDFRDNLLKRALTDGETGLSNGISMRLEAERTVERAERYGFPISLVTIRCEGGDPEHLAELARSLASGVRKSDRLARTGNRELRLLLTHQDADHTARVIERLDSLQRDFCAAREQSISLRTLIGSQMETREFSRLLDGL